MARISMLDLVGGSCGNHIMQRPAACVNQQICLSKNVYKCPIVRAGLGFQGSTDRCGDSQPGSQFVTGEPKTPSCCVLLTGEKDRGKSHSL